jgi:uncharacterized protein YacL
MTQMVIRFILIIACSLSGYFIAFKYTVFPVSLLGLLAGFLVAVFVILLEQAIRKVSLRVIFGGVIGTLIGLIMAFLFAYGLSFVSILEKQDIAPWIYVLLTCILGYLGLVIGSKKSEEMPWTFFGSQRAEPMAEYRILDTSVIIDGRIADVCDTGFMEGSLIVPHFVLDELQHIADSSDSLKRSRGRRGLDILNRMQKSAGMSIEVWIRTFQESKGSTEN